MKMLILKQINDYQSRKKEKDTPKTKTDKTDLSLMKKGIRV